MSSPNYGYGQYAPPPARRSGMERAGKWMFIIGLVLSLLTLAFTVWGFSQLMRAGQALENTTTVQGQTQIPMESNTLRLIVSHSTATSCTATAPDGSNVPVSEENVAPVGGDQDVNVVGAILAEQTGDYTVECTGPAEVSDPLSTGVLLGGVAGIVGVLALIPLGLLTIVGLILWLVGRNRNRRNAQGGYDAGSGPGQGGYGQGPYGQSGGYGDTSGQPYGSQPGASGSSWQGQNQGSTTPGAASSDPYAPPSPGQQGQGGYGQAQPGQSQPGSWPPPQQGGSGQQGGPGQQQPPFPPYGSGPGSGSSGS